MLVNVTSLQIRIVPSALVASAESRLRWPGWKGSPPSCEGGNECPTTSGNF